MFKSSRMDHLSEVVGVYRALMKSHAGMHPAKMQSLSLECLKHHVVHGWRLFYRNPKWSNRIGVRERIETAEHILTAMGLMRYEIKHLVARWHRCAQRGIEEAYGTSIVQRTGNRWQWEWVVSDAPPRLVVRVVRARESNLADEYDSTHDDEVADE